MQMIKGGATIWARQTISSDIFFWKPDKWFKIWFFIVNKVNHCDTKLFERGSNFITYGEISQATKASKNQIDSFIRYAKKQEMMTTQKTTRGMIVYVLKYEVFQALENYKTDKETETQPKHNRNTTETINNNDKNDKNDKNTIAEASSAVVIPDLLQDKQKHIKVIGLFARAKKINFQSVEQQRSFIKRNLRAAKDVAEYDTNRIIEVMDFLIKTADFKWTLESVGKYVDEDLNNLFNRQSKTVIV